jgi:hypothetical protein
MSVWDWVHEYVLQAEEDGDAGRERLYDLLQEAFGHGKENPTLMLAALDAGREHARALGDGWWVLLFDHWRLQCFMNYMLDFRPVLDVAVQATLEARKPANSRLPQRVCLHEDLISGYLGIDPLGHAPAIEKALDYMRQEVSEDTECRYCVQNCRSEFALCRGRLDEVEQSARFSLEMASGDPHRTTADHHSTYAWCDLATVALRRQDWDGLRECADAGEEAARRIEEHLKIGEFLVHQAILARRDGDEGLAGRLSRRALSRVQRVNSLPPSTFYDALCHFHGAAGDLAAALKVRDRELQLLADRGRHHVECHCRLERCRLLARMGLPLDEELAAARGAARHLRDSAPVLEELERIAAGG